MTSTKTADSGTAFRTFRPRFPMANGDSFTPAVPDGENAGSSDRIHELFRMNGISLSADELGELKIFGEFLARHVQPSGSCDVQCMLLWSEWVRIFRRRASGFPDLIREREFREAITGTFGSGIVTDGWRGAVYSGIRFVP
jgi:hypothetical protein